MANISDDLVTLSIKRLIFHDVPNSKSAGSEPTLAEAETSIDANHRTLLKRKLTKVLSSSHAYPVDFDPKSPSVVPGHVRTFTDGASKTSFVEMTRELALHLFDKQHGGISPGLLCAIEVTASGSRGLVLMKLEREEGAQIQLMDHNGKKAFDMSILNNLVLTDGTRLFKSAFFLRIGKGGDDFRSISCDSQSSVSDSSDMAQFWLRFLGVKTHVAPRVATQRFYDSAIQFLNNNVPDPTLKNDLYEHLHSQLKSETKVFVPKKFIEEFIPSDYQQEFKAHLTEHSVPLTSFEKDTSDIAPRIKQNAYLTAQGARVTIPAEKAQLVKIEAARIIVNDELIKIGKQ